MNNIYSQFIYLHYILTSMKTYLLATITLLMLATTSYCQFTLTQSSYPANLVGSDSVSTVYTLTGMPANLNGGVNFLIDFSNLNYFTDTSYVIHLPYSGYSYQEFGVHNVKQPQLYYDARGLFNIESSGINKYGEKLDGKGYSLAALPGAAPTDSIIFPPQLVMFSAPYSKIAFPATFNSTWTPATTESTTFTITYAGTFNHDTCSYLSHLSEKDSVMGYGRAIVKALDGTRDTITVMQVKVQYHQTDSFFIGTLPFDSTTLSLFGFAQGQATNSFEYRFYRVNETTPLVDIFFSDNTFSNSGINHAFVHTQRLVPTAGIVSVAPISDVTIYPNPVINHTFNMNIPAACTGNLSYRVMNIAGKVVTTHNIAATGNTTIQLPQSCSPGIYLVEILVDNKHATVKTIEVK